MRPLPPLPRSRLLLADALPASCAQGWILDPKPVPAPLFPIILRPSHPVQQPPKPAATAWTRGTAKAKPNKAAREALRAGVPLEKPALRRAKRMRIDPRRWGRQRLVFDLAGAKGDAGAGSASMLSVGQWECEGPVETDDQAEAAVAWVFKTRDGQVRRRETVRLTQRSAPHSDNFTAILERMNRAAAPVAPSAAAVDAAAAELAAADAAAAVAAAPQLVRGDAAYRSPSPPPYIPAAPRTLMYNEEDAFALMASALDDDERDAVHQMERRAYRELALGALEELGAVDEVEEEHDEDKAAARPLPKVEGFAQDDDEDDDELFGALRLRGGGGVESSDDSDSSSSDSDSDSSSDSDDDEDGDDSSNTVKQATSSEEPVPAAKPSLKDTLTTLFKPSGATTTAAEDGAAGFSLFSGMDLDLDPDAARTPSPEPEPLDLAPSAAPHALHPQPQQADGRRFVPPTARDGGYRGGASQPRFSGPSRPFFAVPSGAFDGEIDVEALLGEGAADKVERAAGESRARIEGAAKDFYRRETQCVSPFPLSLFLSAFSSPGSTDSSLVSPRSQGPD